jgi:hypothetical protein
MWFTGNLSQPADLLLDWSSLHGQATGRCKISLWRIFSVSLLTGSPAIGKTRLDKTAEEETKTNESSFLEARCSCPHSFDRNTLCKFCAQMRSQQPTQLTPRRMSVRREASPPCLKQENCCLSEASVPLGVPNEGFSTNIASTNGNRRGGALRFSDVPFPQYWSRYGWDLFKDHSVRINPQIRC